MKNNRSTGAKSPGQPGHDWEGILDRVFDIVVAETGHPALDRPKITGDVVGTACLDIDKLTIYENPTWLEMLVEKGMQPEDAVHAVTRHEIRHYTKFPYSLADHIVYAFHSEQHFKEKGEMIFLAYADAVVDGSDLDNPMTVERLKAKAKHYRESSDAVGLLLTQYYSRRCGIELGGEGDEVKVQALLDLKLDPGMSRPAAVANLVQFGNIIKDMVPEPTYVVGLGYGLRGGYGTGFGACISIPSGSKLEAALGQLISAYTKSRFENVLTFLHGKGIQLPQQYLEILRNAQRKHQGTGIGTEKTAFTQHDDLIPYYEARIATFPLASAKRPIVVDESEEERSGKTRFEVDDPIELADRFLTGGRIVAGLTERWTTDPIVRPDRRYRTPHLLLVKDVSGSMMSPDGGFSFSDAASMHLARTYHLNDSMVGVISFGGGHQILPFSRDLQQVYRQILSYEGGGTTPDIDLIRVFLKGKYLDGIDPSDLFPDKRVPAEFMKKHVEIPVEAMARSIPTEDSVDVVTITDGGIYNMEQFLTFIEGHNAIARAAVVLVGKTFDFPDTKKVHILPVGEPQDLEQVSISLAQQFMSTVPG